MRADLTAELFHRPIREADALQHVRGRGKCPQNGSDSTETWFERLCRRPCRWAAFHLRWGWKSALPVVGLNCLNGRVIEGLINKEAAH